MRTFIIINGPVWIILALALVLSVCVYPHISSNPMLVNIIISILIWQCLCAAVMLLIDYKRKYRVYTRLLKISDKRNKKGADYPLCTHTICGYFINRAVITSINTTKKSGIF